MPVDPVTGIDLEGLETVKDIKTGVSLEGLETEPSFVGGSGGKFKGAGFTGEWEDPTKLDIVTTAFKRGLVQTEEGLGHALKFFGAEIEESGKSISDKPVTKESIMKAGGISPLSMINLPAFLTSKIREKVKKEIVEAGKTLQEKGKSHAKTWREELENNPELSRVSADTASWYEPVKLTETIFETLPLTVASIGMGAVATLVTRNPYVGALVGGSMFGSVSAGATFEEGEQAVRKQAEKEGKNPGEEVAKKRQELLEAAELAGLGEVALEFIPGVMFLKLANLDKLGKRGLKNLTVSALQEGQTKLKKLLGFAKASGKMALAEAAEEALQTVKDNLIAKKYYEPEREILTGVPEAATVGGILGVGLGAGGKVIGTAIEAGLPENVDKETGVSLEGLETVEAEPAIDETTGVSLEGLETVKDIIPSELTEEVAEIPETISEQTIQQTEVKSQVEPTKAFIQELTNVRTLAETEPQFTPEKIGLTKGFTNKEIATAIDKAIRNKKLSERELKIYLAALEHSNERFQEAFANNSQLDIEEFIDNSLTRLMQEHFSKAVQEKFIVKQIKKAVEKGTKGKIIITDESILLRKQLRDEARGADRATKITRWQLLKEFKRTQKDIGSTRRMLINYIKQELPLKARGKFLDILKRDLTLKKQASIYRRVIEAKDLIERKELNQEIKDLAKPKGNVDIEYRKQIGAVMQDIDLKNISQKTINKLEGLKRFIEKNPDINIPSEHIKKLSRLAKKSIKNMTSDDVITLRDTLIRLQKLGELKTKLKNKYNERQRQIALDELLDSTRNIDPKLTGATKGAGVKKDIFKKGILNYYLKTLHVPRVMDMIDGFRDYTGENAKLVKAFGAAETDAKFETHTVVDTALQEMIDLGLDNITAQDQVRWAIHIHIQQDAFDQAKTIMAENNMTEVPNISAKEQEAINILRKYLSANVDDIAVISEELTNTIFEKVDNYFPRKYKDDTRTENTGELIKHTRRRGIQIERGFTFARVQGVKRSPRTDILAIFEESINEQQWYLKVMVLHENTKQLVRSKEYLDKAGLFAAQYWKNQLDIIASKGWLASATSNELLRTTRLNLNQAILGYKLSSILMQPFAIFDAMAYAQSRWGTSASLEVLNEFSKAWIRPNQAKEYINTSSSLQMRAAGEMAVEETLEKIGKTKGIVNSFMRGGLSLLRAADLQTAAGVQKGILNILNKHQIPNAEKEAEFLMNMVSGSAEISYRPQILASGEGARLWFTFQNFFLNRWGIMSHDLIRSGLIANPAWKRKAGALIGLGIFMAGSVAEDEAREFMYEKITGKELPETSSILEAFLVLGTNIPYFGNLLSAAIKGGDSDPPLIRAIENIYRGGVQVFKGKKTETKVRGAFRFTENLLAVRLGIPGTAQFFDFMEGIFLRPEEADKRKRVRLKLRRKKR